MAEGDSFWTLIEGGVITSDERAVEVIRRCSSNKVFKQFLAKVGTIIDYARRVHPVKPLSIEGKFLTERNLEASYHGIPSRIVKADIKILDERMKFIMGSHFYLIVSNEGRIIGISNMLI